MTTDVSAQTSGLEKTVQVWMIWIKHGTPCHQWHYTGIRNKDIRWLSLSTAVAQWHKKFAQVPVILVLYGSMWTYW